MKKIIFLMTLLSTPLCLAGVLEMAASANYRTSKIDEFNYQNSSSYTAAISYYFMEMSAIELSYTSGVSTLSVKASSLDPQIKYVTKFALAGADLVLTFAGREALFQPFVKVGAANISKKITQETILGTIQLPEVKPETVPSAGVGFKILITKTFAIKVGLDGWMSNVGEDDETIDYAGRAGISWMF